MALLCALQCCFAIYYLAFWQGMHPYNRVTLLYSVCLQLCFLRKKERNFPCGRRACGQKCGIWKGISVFEDWNLPSYRVDLLSVPQAVRDLWLQGWDQDWPYLGLTFPEILLDFLKMH